MASGVFLRKEVSRRGKASRMLKRKTFELEPRAIKDFEHLKIELGKTGIELIAEALELLFEKYRDGGGLR